MNADPGPRGGRVRGVGGGYCGGRGPRSADAPAGGAEAGGGRYRRAVLETATLALLAGNTTHGYDLMDQIGELAAGLVCIDPGSMYRLLRGLEEQEFVTSSWQPAESGPSRRVYQITEQGIEALEMMAASLSARAQSMQRLADRAASAAAEARNNKTG